MLCPHCLSDSKSYVVKTVHEYAKDTIKRTRLCSNCGKSYDTIETIYTVKHFNPKTLQAKDVPIELFEKNWDKYNNIGA